MSDNESLTDSLDLEDTITSSFTAADVTEESKDKPSPLKSLGPKTKKNRPQALDISGGIGTPVYSASVSNLFDEDTILGTRAGPPSCFRLLLCLTFAGELNLLVELWVAILSVCSLVLGANAVVGMTTTTSPNPTAVFHNNTTTGVASSPTYYNQTNTIACTLLMFPFFITKFHTYFWEGGRLKYDKMDVRQGRYAALLSFGALISVLIMVILSIFHSVTVPLGSFSGGYNRAWLAISQNTTLDDAVPSGPVTLWWIIHRICYVMVWCLGLPAPCACIFPVFWMKSVNQAAAITEMASNVAGIIKENDPATNDDMEERQEMFDSIDLRLEEGRIWMQDANKTLSPAVTQLAVYMAFSIVMITLDIVMPSHPVLSRHAPPMWTMVALLVGCSICLLLLVGIALKPTAAWYRFATKMRHPSTLCHLSFPGFGASEFTKGLEGRASEFTWIFYGVDVSRNVYPQLWGGLVILVSVVVACELRKRGDCTHTPS